MDGGPSLCSPKVLLMGHGSWVEMGRQIGMGYMGPSCEYEFATPTRLNSTVDSRRRRRCVLDLKESWNSESGWRRWYNFLVSTRCYISPRLWLGLQCKLNPPLIFFSHFFQNGWEFLDKVFSILRVPIYAGLQGFIQLSATSPKLRHIKRDHHNVLKMSTIGWNARWVVALNMA